MCRCRPYLPRHRCIYDVTRDPVLAAQLVALIRGGAEAQAQSVSYTPGPVVTSQPVTGGCLRATGSVVVADGSFATDLQVEIADAGGIRDGQLMVGIHGILHPGHGAAMAGGAGSHACPLLAAS